MKTLIIKHNSTIIYSCTASSENEDKAYSYVKEHGAEYSVEEVFVSETCDIDYIKVDFYKPSGKYYTTEKVYMPYEDKKYLPDYFRKSLKDHLKGRLNDMIAVCERPNHVLSYPMMIAVSCL